VVRDKNFRLVTSLALVSTALAPFMQATVRTTSLPQGEKSGAESTASVQGVEELARFSIFFAWDTSGRTVPRTVPRMILGAAPEIVL